jgi:hypothetical protein
VTDAPSIYAKARADVAAMLGFDLDTLTPEQATRLDVGTALRVLLDNQSARLVRGESLDARELLMASEALSRLLPPLRDPPPADSIDPRQIMWETYIGMRRRGELGERAAEPTLREQLAKLQAENAALRAAAGCSPALTPTESDVVPPGEIGECYVGGPRPGPDDPPKRPPVVIEGKAAPAAPPKPAPPPPAAAPAPPATWDETPGGRAWHAWVDAGGPGYDPWADNRR